MEESPALTLTSESWRHIEAVGDIWRHEGLKRGILAELDRHPKITSLAQIIGIDTGRGPKQGLAA